MASLATVRGRHRAGSAKAADVIKCGDVGARRDRTDAWQCGESLDHGVIRDHGGKLIVGARELVVEHFNHAAQRQEGRFHGCGQVERVEPRQKGLGSAAADAQSSGSRNRPGQ